MKNYTSKSVKVLFVLSVSSIAINHAAFAMKRRSFDYNLFPIPVSPVNPPHAYIIETEIAECASRDIIARSRFVRDIILSHIQIRKYSSRTPQTPTNKEIAIKFYSDFALTLGLSDSFIDKVIENVRVDAILIEASDPYTPEDLANVIDILSILKSGDYEE